MAAAGGPAFGRARPFMVLDDQSTFSERVGIFRWRIGKRTARLRARHGGLCEGLRTPARHGRSHTHWAGVGKPPVKEPAGGLAPMVQQALWGFGVWRWGVGVKQRRSGAAVGVSGRRVLVLPGANSAMD